MARASPIPSFSSSSSALSSSASPPSSSGTRKKKNIGALLNRYYNLENETKREESDISSSAASSFVRGQGVGAAAVAASGATSSSSVVKQLQQQSRVPSVVSGGDRAAAGATSTPVGGSIAVRCTSSNPFSAAEASSCLVSSGLGDKREDALSASSRSPRAAGGGAVAAAAGIDGCSNSSQNRRGSSVEVVRRSLDRLGDETATAVSKKEGHAATGALTTTTAVSGARQGGKCFAAAAEGALAAAAGGLGFLLGEEEDNKSPHDMRWTEKEEETGPSFSEDSRRDLDSEHFDVRAFFSAAVESMSLRELLQASSKLDEEVRQCEGELQMLVYENYTKFLEAAETVRGVKEDMHALEGDMTQLAVRAAVIEGSSKELDDLVRDRAASIEELVSFRQLLDKLQILFTLPDVLRWYLSNEDVESVVSLYLHLHPFLQEQETAFPTLQRLRLLHTEATTLFQAAKRWLRQQLLVSQAADCEGSFPLDVSRQGSSMRTRKALSGRNSSSERSSTSRKDVLLLDQTASDAGEEGVQFISAGAASRVFDLLLRAGESPREVLELYIDSRIHVLQLLLLRVFEPHRMLLAAQPTPQGRGKPAQQQQHPGAQQGLVQSQSEQQQQRDRQCVCPEDGSASSQRIYARGEGATATPRSSVATAAAAEEYTAAATNASSAAAEQMLQVACCHLNQQFMEPFLTALQDILRLRPSSDRSLATSGQACGGRSAPAAAAGPPSAVVEIAIRGRNAAPSSAAGVTPHPTPAAVDGGRTASDSLSTDELDEKLCTFLMPLLLRVLEGFLRLTARLHPPPAAVVETMRKLRAMLLQPLHKLVLPELVQQQITECFQNFTYQVLSVCVAEAFRSAYFQAAEELGAIQRFCFSGAASAAAGGAAAFSTKTAAAAAAAAANTEQTASPHADPDGNATELRPQALVTTQSHFCLPAAASPAFAFAFAVDDMQLDSVCFFLNEKQQEDAQQLLSQKEHAVLLRGCLAVTDVHKLIDGVCGVRSSLAEKLVLQELGTWTEGYFSVFVAALLRLVRDVPAALQVSPLLRAEAEFLRCKETRGCSSSGANSKDERSSASRKESHSKKSDSKRNGTDFRNAFVEKEGDEEKEDEKKKKHCYRCCYCWRVDAEPTAENGPSPSIKRERENLVYGTTDIALLEKTLVSRCVSVEEEVQEAVAAAVVKHLATALSASERLPGTAGEDRDSCEVETSVENSRSSTLQRENSAICGTGRQQRSRRLPSEDASEGDVPRTNASEEARHAESVHRDVLAKHEMSAGNEKEEKSDASIKRTDLSYVGKSAVCCVLLMRIGHSLELHGVSKIVAVAAELFPSFPVNAFDSTAAVPGVLEIAAADGSAATTAVASPPVGEHGTALAVVPESTAAGATTGATCGYWLPKQQQRHTVVKEPPLLRLRRVLQAALVTYVYLRGCQGASLSTAALRQMLAHKLPSAESIALPLAAAAAPCTACGPTAGASPAPADTATGVAEDAKTPAAAGKGEGEYDRASEWLRLKDREAQERLAVQRAEDIDERASPAVNNAPTEGPLDLPPDAAGMHSQAEAAGALTHPSSADSHSNNTMSPAESAVFLSAQRDVPWSSHSHTADSTVRRATDSSNAVPPGFREENATDSSGEDAIDSAGVDVEDAVSAEAVADGVGVQDMPVGVIGLMDTLLLLLHHCDEETFVFLGEQRLAGSGILLLRKGSRGGGVSGALLPGNARLPRRLQAAAAAGDAAAATVEQSQQQHVRRLARLFGRRRTAIEKEMERLFGRKQPVFSRVSLNRHKALMAIFKVACRPFLEAVRNTLFTCLEVRQMQVECAAAAENLRDLVASEDGCVVDGLLDEVVASSLRRCLHANQVSEPIDDTRIGYCGAAGGMDSRTSAESRRILGSFSVDVGRSRPVAAVSRWSSGTADSSVSAAFTRMTEGRGTGTGEKEGSGVLLEPALVEEICGRSSDRYHFLQTNSKGIS